MKVRYDDKLQPFIEWEQARGVFMRIWIQSKDDFETDWAKAERYLRVVRCDAAGQPGEHPTDFPIFNGRLSDVQILRTFFYSTNTIIGCPLPIDS